MSYLHWVNKTLQIDSDVIGGKDPFIRVGTLEIRPHGIPRRGVLIWFVPYGYEGKIQVKNTVSGEEIVCQAKITAFKTTIKRIRIS
jgi:hypothetical protein